MLAQHSSLWPQFFRASTITNEWDTSQPKDKGLPVKMKTSPKKLDKPNPSSQGSPQGPRLGRGTPLLLRKWTLVMSCSGPKPDPTSFCTWPQDPAFAPQGILVIKSNASLLGSLGNCTCSSGDEKALSGEAGSLLATVWLCSADALHAGGPLHFQTKQQGIQPEGEKGTAFFFFLSLL